LSGPFLFSLFITLTVLLVFVGVWRLVLRRGDAVGDRLRDYATGELEADEGPRQRRPQLTGMNRLVNGFGLGPRLATALARADLPWTAAEFALLVVGAGMLGLFVGLLRQNLVIGLLLGALLAGLPLFYLRIAQARRRRAFINQLPDVLTLLVGALRAGYGLSQALEVLVEQMPPPSSSEFARIVRATNLGVPLQRALYDAAERVDSDDLDLVVTAISVQYEMGGNLTTILETIGDTIRDRIRILREVRVLTAQQRLTGYILAAAPVVFAVVVSILRPGHFDPFFEPGLVRVLPIISGGMIFIGFLLVQRIVDIEV
jgi:tight adherence protein B